MNSNQILVGSFSEILVFKESQIELKFHKDEVFGAKFDFMIQTSALGLL